MDSSTKRTAQPKQLYQKDSSTKWTAQPKTAQPNGQLNQKDSSAKMATENGPGVAGNYESRNNNTSLPRTL